MAGEGHDGGSSLEVPDAGGAVVGGGTKLAGVSGEGEVRDSLFVSRELGAEGEVGGGPHAENLVGGGRRKEGAVGGELYR